jgi:hypothetical protein
MFVKAIYDVAKKQVNSKKEQINNMTYSPKLYGIKYRFWKYKNYKDYCLYMSYLSRGYINRRFKRSYKNDTKRIKIQTKKSK